MHGTTQGLDAFLQRRGEKVVLLASSGAGDVYHVARGNRTRLYDIHYRKPTPLVARSDIVQIGGRLNYAARSSSRWTRTRSAKRRVAQDEGFGAVAVGFLFSYLNPAHELRAEEILLEELDGVAISSPTGWPASGASTSVRPRPSSTPAPVVRRYLERLESELTSRGLAVPLHTMQSSGGIVTASRLAI